MPRSSDEYSAAAMRRNATYHVSSFPVEVWVTAEHSEGRSRHFEFLAIGLCYHGQTKRAWTEDTDDSGK